MPIPERHAFERMIEKPGGRADAAAFRIEVSVQLRPGARQIKRNILGAVVILVADFGGKRAAQPGDHQEPPVPPLKPNPASCEISSRGWRRTVIIIAHRLLTVRHVADEIVVLEDGAIVEHDEWLPRNGWYAEMARLQAIV